MSVIDAAPTAGLNVAFANSPSYASTVRASMIARSFRVAMTWQGAITLVIGLVAALFAGANGLLSALAGGVIGIVGVLVFALVSNNGFSLPPGRAMRVALRAEGARIAAIVLLLWLCFAGYREMVVPAFILAFIVSIFLSGVAFAVPNK